MAWWLRWGRSPGPPLAAVAEFIRVVGPEVAITPQIQLQGRRAEVRAVVGREEASCSPSALPHRPPCLAAPPRPSHCVPHPHKPDPTPTSPPASPAEQEPALAPLRLPWGWGTGRCEA